MRACAKPTRPSHRGYNYRVIGTVLGPKNCDVELHNPLANAVPRIFDQCDPADIRVNLLGAKAIDKFDMFKE